MRTTLFGVTAALALLVAAPAFAQSAEPEVVNPLPPQPLSVEHAPSNPPMTGPKLLISTSMGDITLQLDAERVPEHDHLAVQVAQGGRCDLLPVGTGKGEEP